MHQAQKKNQKINKPFVWDTTDTYSHKKKTSVMKAIMLR